MYHMHQGIENLKLFKSLPLFLLQIIVLDSTKYVALLIEFQNCDGIFLFCSFTFSGAHRHNIESTGLPHPVKESRCNRVSMLSQNKDTTHGYKEK